ncbi:hypothetical protein CHUAL_013278 [Chamberlinius hualienensis]
MKHLTLLLVVSCAVATLAASYSAENPKPEQREKRFLPLLFGGLLGSMLGRKGRSVQAVIPNVPNNNVNKTPL